MSPRYPVCTADSEAAAQGGRSKADYEPRQAARVRSTAFRVTQLTVISCVTTGAAPAPGNADPMPLNSTAFTL